MTIEKFKEAKGILRLISLEEAHLRSVRFDIQMGGTRAASYESRLNYDQKSEAENTLERTQKRIDALRAYFDTL